MKKSLILSLSLLCSYGAVKAMEKPLNPRKSQQAAVSISEKEECIVCNDDARTIRNEKGEESILQTTCCKQFLCRECFSKVKTSAIKTCPQCRRDNEFQTTKVTIAIENSAPVVKKPDLSQEQWQGIVERQRQIENQIELENKQKAAARPRVVLKNSALPTRQPAAAFPSNTLNVVVEQKPVRPVQESQTLPIVESKDHPQTIEGMTILVNPLARINTFTNKKNDSNKNQSIAIIDFDREVSRDFFYEFKSKIIKHEFWPNSAARMWTHASKKNFSLISYLNRDELECIIAQLNAYTH